MPSKKMDLIQSLIEELSRIQASEHPYHPDGFDHGPASALLTEMGGHLMISRRMDRDIHRLAALSYANAPQARGTLSLVDWTGNIRATLGAAFGNMDLIWPLSVQIDHVRKRLKEDAPTYLEAARARDHVFGSMLLHDPADCPFSIGPVHFETRTSWLETLRQTGKITAVTHRRIARAWAGNRLRARATSIDAYRERDLLDGVCGAASGDRFT